MDGTSQAWMETHLERIAAALERLVELAEKAADEES